MGGCGACRFPCSRIDGVATSSQLTTSILTIEPPYGADLLRNVSGPADGGAGVHLPSTATSRQNPAEGGRSRARRRSTGRSCWSSTAMSRAPSRREYGGFGAARRAGSGASSPRSSPAPASIPASRTRASACWCRRCSKSAPRSRSAHGSSRPSAARSSGARATPSPAPAATSPPQDAARVCEDGHFVINGQKIWTSSAHYADMMFLLCRTEPDKPKHEGSQLPAAADERRPASRCARCVTMTGRANSTRCSSPTCACPSTRSCMGRGEGWDVANVTLKHERRCSAMPTSSCSRLSASSS